ncbi:MAG TPA: Ig-like domain-containing protein, partial [Bacillota bacterium]|nr:Ig-like domain-containing protein [Bacillota bacterium]
ITVPPSLSIGSPADGAIFSAPTNITIKANAFDRDGSISRVYFYTNNTLVGSSTTQPYSVLLANPAPGTYSIDAIAVDNLGGARQSSAITISVNTNGFISDPLYTGVTNQFNEVSFLNSQVGYICGVNGTVLVTTDGGMTWTRLNTDATNNINAIQVVGPDIFIAGDNGLLSVSSNGGQSWMSFYVGTSVSFYSASLITPYYGFAAGANGTIYAFNGTSWTQQTTGTTVDFYGIVAIGSTGWAVGANGTIYRYNGTKWVAQSSGTTVSLYDVAFYNASYGYVVGAGGTIRKTTNGGTNWVAQTSGVTNTLRKVYVLDLNTAWCVGDGGVVLQTTNGGTAWTLVRSGGSDFTGMDFADGRGILVGPGGTAYDFLYQPVPVNLPPSVWLTSPYPGAAVNAGTTLNLTASASDASGISKVEFYQGSTLLGTATTIPYTLAWNATVAGGYSLTALAYDNQGAYAWSSPVTLTVNPAVDLGLSMAVSPTTISITNTVTFTLVVTNRGPSTATGVQLRNVMPSDF